VGDELKKGWHTNVMMAFAAGARPLPGAGARTGRRLSSGRTAVAEAPSTHRHDPASTLRAIHTLPIAEFEIVAVTDTVEAEGHYIPMVNSGTIVAIHGHGELYAVEIAGLPGRPKSAMLRAHQIESVH
jgi:hypothetical protein